MKWLLSLRDERHRKHNEIAGLRLSSLGRAIHWRRICQEFLERDVRERIAIYKRVADEKRCPEMLSKAHLDRLRERIMTTVHTTCGAFRDQIERDCRVAGDANPLQIDASVQRIPFIESAILDVVNAELRVLQAEGVSAPGVGMLDLISKRPDAAASAFTKAEHDQSTVQIDSGEESSEPAIITNGGGTGGTAHAKRLQATITSQIAAKRVASTSTESVLPAAAGPVEPSAAEDLTESAHSTEANRPTVVLGTAGQPMGRPRAGLFVSDPAIRKLVDEHPEVFPHVSLVALERAQAEAEVAFREREIREHWGEWSGIHPWDDTPRLDTTDCPWWVAGAEYVSHVATEWREHSPGRPEKVEAVLPKLIPLVADWIYWNRIFVHDGVHAKKPKLEDLLGRKNAERFSNVAFLFAMRKFAENDLDEWRGRAAVLAGAITDLKGGSASQSASQSAPGVSEPPSPAKENAGTTAQEVQGPKEGRKGKKPVRRNQKYKVIDAALEKVSDGHPSTQEEVFQSLDARHVVIPPAEPFITAHGWIAGFRRDEAAARAWLSKRWAELDLTPLPRGPKNPKK
ncbi:MAG: hypothetical protein HYR60_18840 [Acidobacteria bacterium]|nr:hypothetical protein [Acidobacteriota bacterium]